MNDMYRSRPGSRTVCTEPACVLHGRGLSTPQLADFLVGAMAGESLEQLAPDCKCINPGPKCRQCAARVMQGGLPYRTEAEWKHLDELGRWCQRRRRRQLHWGFRG